jgi:carboxyl-terminal processing protease
VVYYGGGIEPDIASEPYEYSDISACLISKYLIFDFATQYKMKHPEIAKAKDFEVPDDLFNEFVTYLNDKEYDYTTESERNLKELKESAEKEKYFDDFKVEYEALKNKMMHNKKADLIKFKSEIKELLKEEIVSRYYFQRGRIEVALQSDELVKKAIEVLKDNNRYKSLLISNANKK